MEKRIPDNSIDMIFTSPPYDNIREYNNDWEINLPNVGKQISRILVDGGVAIMLIQDQTQRGRKSLSSFKTIVNWCENTELDLWECLIYQRNGTPGAWWNKRFRVDHEYIPIFLKGERPQHFSKDHMKVKAEQAGQTAKIGGRKSNGETVNLHKVEYAKKKGCGTILDYTNEKNGENFHKELKKEHPATFPDKIAKDFIKIFSAPNMIALDPFIGSGTTAVAAKALDRKYIGFEQDKEYYEIAQKRVDKVQKELIR